MTAKQYLKDVIIQISKVYVDTGDIWLSFKIVKVTIGIISRDHTVTIS